jgi:hypothetical protein
MMKATYGLEWDFPLLVLISTYVVFYVLERPLCANIAQCYVTAMPCYSSLMMYTHIAFLSKYNVPGNPNLVAKIVMYVLSRIECLFQE